MVTLQRRVRPTTPHARNIEIMTGLPELTSGLAFDEACRLILKYLHDHVPLGFWAITRVENGRQTFLSLDDNAYGLPMGGSHLWEDSYCIHMVAGAAPRIAPDAAAIPAYAKAKINETVLIGAYAGAPIHDADGELFRAICGFDPQRQPANLIEAGPLLELMTRLLSLILTSERWMLNARKASVLARTEATSDALTGLLNRRGWDSIVADEAKRYQRFADPTVVVMVDLDNLKTINDHGGGHLSGDRYLVAAAAALSATLREGDPVARIGGTNSGFC